MRSRLFTSAAVIAALLVSLSAVGCSKQENWPKLDTKSSTETSAAATSSAGVPLGRETSVTAGELISSLRASGLNASVLPYNKKGVFQPADLTVVKVNGNNVQLYRFRDNQQAYGAAKTVENDGFVVGYTPDQSVTVNWAGWPAFFRSGDLIVVFITAKDAQANPARDTKIFKALEKIFGPPFSGGQTMPKSIQSHTSTSAVAATSSVASPAVP